jgi:hypothetical protein
LKNKIEKNPKKIQSKENILKMDLKKKEKEKKKPYPISQF